MELKQIHCFLMVAKYLNFSVAAEKMYLSQPSLSRHISNLERDLGVQLFKRDKQSVALTEAGLQCLPAARRLLNAYQEIHDTAQNLRDGNLGSLRIGYQASARTVLPGLLQRFSAEYPSIDLFIEEIPAKNLIQKLDAGSLDIVFAFTVILNGLPSYTYLEQQPLYLDRMALFVGWETYLNYYTKRGSCGLEDFEEETFIQISYENNPFYFNFLHSIYVKSQFTPLRIEEEPNMNTLMLMIQAGLGVSLLPQHSTLEYFPSAHYIPLKDVDVTLPIAAIWQPQNCNPCLPLLRSLCPENPLVP